VTGDPRLALMRELRARVPDDRVLRAMEAVPRELFVPPDLVDRAYEDGALAIGCGQTISQPLVVARMAHLLELEPDDRVLDVGTGSGYHAAVLARLAGQVWTIERHRSLAQRAAAVLRDAGVENVTVLVGDGSQGLPEHAPYDASSRPSAGAGSGWSRCAASATSCTAASTRTCGSSRSSRLRPTRLGTSPDGAVLGRRERQPDAHTRAAGGRALDRKGSTELGRPVAHRRQPHADGSVRP
jgi:protein-L-isoaspartate(D-aspartate) O-methyltransferase